MNLDFREFSCRDNLYWNFPGGTIDLFFLLITVLKSVERLIRRAVSKAI